MQQLVKIRGPKEDVPAITSQDINIVSLRSLISDLTAQLEVLVTKINESSQKARTSISKKNRASAMANLRTKKLHESLLARRSETLAQLEAVYTKIQEAADQVDVMRVMQASTEALKGLHSEIGGVETVEDVLAGLREQMDSVDDIGTIIHEFNRGTAILDEGVVDEELESLEREELAKEGENSALETQKRIDLIDSQTTATEFKSQAARKAPQDDQTEFGSENPSDVAEVEFDKSTKTLGLVSLDESKAADEPKKPAKDTDSSKRLAVLEP